MLIEDFADPASTPAERVVLRFDTRCKSRLRAKLESGEICGLFLPRGTVLRGGDKLLGSDLAGSQTSSSPSARTA